MSGITVQELRMFHGIDREIFTRLVVNLVRDPGQSLLVMALWLCLEEMKFPRIISKMVQLPDSVVNLLADEAFSILRCLESFAPPMPGQTEIPFTCITMGTNLSLERLYQNKYTMISGIKTFLNNLCTDAFSDILLQVLQLRGGLVNLTAGDANANFNNYPIPIPGFPHPTFGSIVVIPRALDYKLPSQGVWGGSPLMNVPEDDRTLFLTFSRGYPVTEIEVTALFNAHYGDCVEYVRMVASSSSSSSSSEHPLYARLVLRKVSTLDQVLRGGPIAKFRINGKHVWARKYERRL